MSQTGQAVPSSNTGGDASAAKQDITNAVLGTTADAVVAAGAAGTHSAKLRLLTAQIAALILQLPATLGIKTAATSLSVAPASDALFQLGVIGAVTDRSLNIAAGGTRQVLMVSNANRRGLFIQNPSTEVESIWIRDIAGSAAVGQPSIEVVPGTSLTFEPPSYVPLTAIDIYAATTGHKVTAREW